MKDKFGELIFASSPEASFALMAGEYQMSQVEARTRNVKRTTIASYTTTVRIQILWHGIHDFTTTVFPGRLWPKRIAAILKEPEAVSFQFKIMRGRKVVRPFGRAYFLGGNPIKDEGKIVTRHGSQTFFHKGDVVLRGF